MWLGIKQAATKRELPDLHALMSEGLGATDAIKYRKMVERYPRVVRGSDESLADHLSRLDSHHDKMLSRNPDVARRADDPTAQVRTEERTVAPWADLPDSVVEQNIAGPDLEPESSDSDLPRRTPRTPPRLPERDPGWYTNPESQSAGFGAPPMSRRTPGDSLAPSHGPSYVPDQQSMQDWVKWLGTKGITVDHTLQRPDAAQRQEPYRPLTGPEIWPQFVGPSTDASLDKALRDLPESAGGLGRSWKQRAKDLFSTRKSSAVVTEYIEGVLVATATVRGGMEDEGWTHHESGSGNWYEKQIGDQLHRIVAQPDGWIHAHGPVDGEKDEYGDPAMTGTPMMHDTLRDAMLHAHRGQYQVGFTAKPPTSLRSMNAIGA